MQEVVSGGGEASEAMRIREVLLVCAITSRNRSGCDRYMHQINCVYPFHPSHVPGGVPWSTKRFTVGVADGD